MPAKKTTVVTSRTIKARLSDTAMLGKLEKLKADKGWNDSDLLREALKEYLERERLRDDLATMDKRFGSTLKRLAQKQNVMRSEMAVLVAFMGCATSKVPFVAPGAVVGQAAIVTVEPVCKNGGLSKDGVVSITEIDGLRTSPSAFGKPNPVAYVAAGEHKFSVEHALGHGAFHAQLRLHAEAATSYLLHCEGSWRERFWFTEASTGRVVGGLVDP